MLTLQELETPLANCEKKMMLDVFEGSGFNLVSPMMNVWVLALLVIGLPMV